MAKSVVGICNIALSQLGQEAIADILDNNKRARACNARYDDVRDGVLRAHRWNCAMSRAVLTKLSTAPAFGFDNTFQLPADFIRMSQLDDINIKFRIEGGSLGRVLLSNDDTINLQYVYRLTDVPAMDELLVQTIGVRLAAEIALQLTGSPRVAQGMTQLYELKLSEARFADSQESPVETIRGSTWINARRGIQDDQLARKIDLGV